MKDLLKRIEALESRISEKEHEIQLLKDDLETLRAALEAAIEEDTSIEEETTEVSNADEHIDEVRTETAQIDEADEDQSKPQAEDVPHKEQDHEAIIRTIEEFASKKKKASVVYDGPIGDRETLSDKVGGSKLNDIKKAIGVNERFLYANELFNGDMGAFIKAVEELNHIESKNDAERLLEEDLSVRYSWDEESDTVNAFKSLVSRRFA